MAGMNCTSFRTTESKLICLERSTLLWHENQQALFFPLVWMFLTKAYLFYLIFLIHKPNATKHWLGVPYLTGTASQTGKYRIRGQQSPSCYSPSVPKCHLPVWQTFGWDWNEKKKKKISLVSPAPGYLGSWPSISLYRKQSNPAIQLTGTGSQADWKGFNSQLYADKLYDNEQVTYPLLEQISY